MPANIELNMTHDQTQLKPQTSKSKKNQQQQQDPVVMDTEIENLNNQIELEQLEQGFSINPAGRQYNSSAVDVGNIGIIEDLD